MLGLSGYILADTFFIARDMGAGGLAALNFSLPVYCVINGTGLMLGMGGATRFTILMAGNKKSEASRVFTHAVILGLAAGFLMMAAGIASSAPLAGILGADGDALPMTGIYLKTILCFAPCFITNNVLLAFVRNDANPRLAMAGMLTGSLSNILLDYVFIFPLGMGMFGAAFATGLAPVLSMCVLLTHVIRRKNKFHLVRCRVKLSYFCTIASLGLSAFITELSSGIVLAAFNLVILGLEGNTGVAAYGIVANLALVATSIFTGIAQGIQPMASRGYGTGEQTMVRQTLKYAAGLSLLLSALIYAGSNLASDPLIGLFNSEGNEALVPIARNGLRLYFAGFFFAGINIVAAAFLSAVEKQKSAFLISISRGCLVILPLLFILSAFFQMNGVWLAFTGAELLTFVYTWAKLH